MQWHPLFAQLLRPLLEHQFEVRTNVPVGDAPRAADVILLRRTSHGTHPFRGLWRWLTTWNVLEFKGPTVSARVDDLDALPELGLGIQRRLNEERADRRQPRVGRDEVSFWYLANHLGSRFLAASRRLAGPAEPLAAGVWRGSVWQRPLILVSSREVAVERDSLPLHLLSAEPVAVQREVTHVLAAQIDLWPSYAGWLATIYPTLVEELNRMGRTRREGLTINVVPLFEHLGWQEILRQVGLENLVTQLSAEQRQELLRLLQQTPPPEGHRRVRR
jgi:hypothetical protein